MKRTTIIPFFLLALSGLAGDGLMRDPESAVHLKVMGAHNRVEATRYLGGKEKAFALKPFTPYYVLSATETAYRICNRQEKPRKEGYVRKKDVHIWNTREGLALNLDPIVWGDDVRAVYAWKQRAMLQGWLDEPTEKAHQPDYRRVLGKDPPDFFRPYPLLDTALMRGKVHERHVANVLIPAYVERRESLTMTPEETRRFFGAMDFCVVFDATNSMEPYAEAMARVLDHALQPLAAIPGNRISVGFVFFKDRKDADRFWIEPPRPVHEASRTLKEAMKKIGGGGDMAEPVLDALLIAARKFPWGSGAGRPGAKKVIILVANAGVHEKTVGLDPSIPPGLGGLAVYPELNENDITAFTIEAGFTDPGFNGMKNLRPALGLLASKTGGAFYPYDEETGLSRGFVAHIAEKLREVVHRHHRRAEYLKKVTVERARRDRDVGALPLEILSEKERARLRESKHGDRLDSTVFVEESWLLYNRDLFQERVLVDKPTLETLHRFLQTFSDAPVDTEECRRVMQSELQILLGERVPMDADLEELLARKLALNFQTGMLSMDLDWLLADTERRKIFAARLNTKREQIGRFLERNSAAFAKRTFVWMPLEYLP